MAVSSARCFIICNASFSVEMTGSKCLLSSASVSDDLADFLGVSEPSASCASAMEPIDISSPGSLLLASSTASSSASDLHESVARDLEDVPAGIAIIDICFAFFHSFFANRLLLVPVALEFCKEALLVDCPSESEFMSSASAMPSP